MSLLTQFTTAQGFIGNIAYIYSSRAWVAPKTGTYRVTLVGGGGSGGSVGVATAITQYGAATGGGAGGLVQKTLSLVAGQSATVTIGAGGTAAGGYAISAGVNGSSSSWVDGTNTLTAGGGAGGQASGVSTTLAGGVGGTATGGDVNITGGAGGAISSAYASANLATGGGAVGMMGIGYAGGSITCPANAALMATGGGGVGGRGGNITVATATSGGGGAGGPAPDLSTGVPGPNVEGRIPAYQSVAAIVPAFSIAQPIPMIGHGSWGGYEGSTTDIRYNCGGGGGGGGVRQGSGTGIYGVHASAFGGGGGFARGAAAGSATGGDGMLGGGGGASVIVSGVASAYGGVGGNGFAIIEW